MEMVRAKIDAHLAGETPHLSLEYRMLHRDGSLRWMLSRGMALPDEQGRPHRLTGANTEITELKQVQEALLYRIGLEEFVTTMSTLFINLPTDQIDDEINNALDIIGKFFGVDCGFIATSIDTGPEWQIYCSWRTEAISPKLQVGLKVPVHEFEWSLDQIRRYDSLYIPQVSGLPASAQADQAFFQALGLEAILALPMYLNGALFGLVGLATARGQKNWSSDTIAPLKLVSQMFVNALERKRVEEQVQASLQEKEVLLKEIHHRVKNNLQVISSLLYLQASNIDDERVQDIFRESQSRIKSMALIHENLYQTENFTKIDLAGYISNLVDYLLQVYVIDPASIKVRLDIAEVELDIDTMIPCGLVITELITNALKYAFPQTATRAIDEPPEIWVNLQEEPAGRIVLFVGNNGTGLPADLNLEQADTLGLKLVNRLVKQLDGSFELDHSQGVVFKITFSSGKVI
jgi:two-component sensor histidine kinase